MMLNYFACDANGCEKYVYDHACYWVEIRDTMVCMMREPRGQVIKSMLGFLIFSSRSWSSSQRSSFTSSATYMDQKKNPNTDSRWSVPFFPLCFVYSWSECITHTDTNSDNELLLHVRRQWIESSHHPERWWTHHVVGPHWPAPHRIAPLDTHIPYCNLG